jgi:hypothetical protein
VHRNAAPLIAALALMFIAGCAHYHRVGSPPTVDDIAEINLAGGGQPISVSYVDSLASCVGGLCSVSGASSVPSGPPSDIQRIVSAEQHQLTVVTSSGERWTLPADGVLAVTTRGHATGQGALGGGVFGLLVGSLVAYVAYAGNIGADQTVESYGHKPASAGTALTIWAGVTAVGALVGTIVGSHTSSFDTYQLGPGPSLGPATGGR